MYLYQYLDKDETAELLGILAGWNKPFNLGHDAGRSLVLYNHDVCEEERVLVCVNTANPDDKNLRRRLKAHRFFMYEERGVGMRVGNTIAEINIALPDNDDRDSWKKVFKWMLKSEHPKIREYGIRRMAELSNTPDK